MRSIAFVPFGGPLSQALLAILCAVGLWGCRDDKYCEDQELHHDVRELGHRSHAFWRCDYLCEQCGFEGAPASCQDGDEEAYCECAGGPATFCDSADTDGLRCGESSCE